MSDSEEEYIERQETNKWFEKLKDKTYFEINRFKIRNETKAEIIQSKLDENEKEKIELEKQKRDCENKANAIDEILAKRIGEKERKEKIEQIKREKRREEEQKKKQLRLLENWLSAENQPMGIDDEIKARKMINSGKTTTEIIQSYEKYKRQRIE